MESKITFKIEHPTLIFTAAGVTYLLLSFLITGATLSLSLILFKAPIPSLAKY
jgi:hypothetical protein